jgi:hypothetical protein
VRWYVTRLIGRRSTPPRSSAQTDDRVASVLRVAPAFSHYSIVVTAAAAREQPQRELRGPDQLPAYAVRSAGECAHAVHRWVMGTDGKRTTAAQRTSPLQTRRTLEMSRDRSWQPSQLRWQSIRAVATISPRALRWRCRDHARVGAGGSKEQIQNTEYRMRLSCHKEKDTDHTGIFDSTPDQYGHVGGMRNEMVMIFRTSRLRRVSAAYSYEIVIFTPGSMNTFAEPNSAGLHPPAACDHCTPDFAGMPQPAHEPAHESTAH